MKNRILLLSIAVTVLLLIGCDNGSVRKSIPITNFDGLKPWLSKENDSVYVINFWATWCTPCVKEFPDFESINKKYQNKKVKILMVNLDFPDQYKKRVLPFIKARKTKLDIVMLDDPNQNLWINSVDKSWSGAIPATLVYSSKKRSFHESELSFNQLDSLINEHQINNN